VIDYALARRATLANLQRGVVSRREVCDAHPDLLRAARYHGEPSGKVCPVCRIDGRGDRPLALVTYAFGAELRESSGRARAQSELATLSQCHADLRVYVVEVCRACSWNHLSSSFAIGTGESSQSSTRPSRRRVAGK
jgi:hypothetical protein